MLLFLTACGSTPPSPGADGPSQPEVPAQQETPPAPEPEPVPEPEPYAILDPTVMPEGGSRDGVAYAAYDGVVEHLFFHPVVAYPELAFDGDHKSDGIDDWMVTAGDVEDPAKPFTTRDTSWWTSPTAGGRSRTRTASPGW